MASRIMMLHDGLERRGEAFDFVDRARDGFKLHDDVTEELPRRGVDNGAFVAELFELADIVEDARGEQEIDIELGIMRGDAARHAAERDDVFEQAAEIGMVHHFGGRRAFVAAGGFGIDDYAQDQLLEPGIGDGFGVAAQLHKHFFDVGGGVRESSTNIFSTSAVVCGR